VLKEAQVVPLAVVEAVGRHPGNATRGRRVPRRTRLSGVARELGLAIHAASTRVGTGEASVLPGRKHMRGGSTSSDRSVASGEGLLRV
jgi:hypothetical protein